MKAAAAVGALLCALVLAASAPATCSFSVTGSGPVRLFNGTGLYKGITGSAEMTLSFGGIAPRLTSGAHKGDCNPNQNAKALSQYGAIIGRDREVLSGLRRARGTTLLPSVSELVGPERPGPTALRCPSRPAQLPASPARGGRRERRLRGR